MSRNSALPQKSTEMKHEADNNEQMRNSYPVISKDKSDESPTKRGKFISFTS